MFIEVFNRFAIISDACHEQLCRDICGPLQISYFEVTMQCNANFSKSFNLSLNKKIILVILSCRLNDRRSQTVGTNRETMKIHLIRHAKTEPTSQSGRDFDRRLLPKGVAQANVLGYYFSQHSIQPSYTYCSDALRTRETLEIISHGNSVGKIIHLNELYLSDREIYLQIIWNLKHKKDLLIVGHNDGISSLVSYLLEAHYLMKTGHYVCLEFEADSWGEISRGTGRLIADFRPSIHVPD
jgi:phosphohistidine phosphatase